MSNIKQLLDQHAEDTTTIGLLALENARLRTALQQIRDNEGKVCPYYDICTHPACRSSYHAWAIAGAALAAGGGNHIDTEIQNGRPGLGIPA